MKESITETVKEYLYFTKSERIGAITLVILFIAVAYSYFNYANQPPAVDQMLILQQEMAQLKLELKQQQATNKQQSYSKSYQSSNYKKSGSYSNQRKRTYKTSNQPYNKRNYKKQQTPPHTNQQKTNNQTTNTPATPEVRSSKHSGYAKTVSQRTAIAKTTSAPADFTKTRKTTNPKPKKRFRKPLKVDINKATAESFQRLYGIGPAYSKRIVKFREALGGFNALHQISEVYGLPDSTFQSILPNLEFSQAILNKIDINSASKDEMSMHPYLHWKQAKIIVAYREMHGSFEQFEDLKKIHGLEIEAIQKLKPYLKFDKEPLVVPEVPKDSVENSI